VSSIERDLRLVLWPKPNTLLARWWSMHETDWRHQQSWPI